MYVVNTLPQRIYIHQPVEESGLNKEQCRLDSSGMTGVKVGRHVKPANALRLTTKVNCMKAEF